VRCPCSDTSARLPASPSEAASDTKLCQSNSHGTTCDVTLVITGIDYYNSILAGLPACTLAPLQRVQNAAARLVLNLDRRSHISPALQHLHWLPVKYRVTSKIATLILYQILHNRCPSYLVDLVTYNVTDPQRRQLRSSTTRAAVVRRTRTEFGKRAFSVCGPDVWNSRS